MRVDNLELDTDVYKLIEKLQLHLRNSGIKLITMSPKESGDYLLIQCPYHKNGQERHPSAQIRKDDALFYCHNCKITRSFSKLVSDCLETNGKQWLIDNFQMVESDSRNISFFSTKDKKTTKSAYLDKNILAKYRRTHPYMYERKLDLETIRKFDIGYDEETECITFPNKDEFGNILFIARRSVKTKFFHYPSNVDKPVYGLYEILREIRHGKTINEVYVCESMLDALYIWRLGKYAIALNGTGSAKQYDILRKSHFRTFILAFDNDSAGKNAREKFRKNVKNKFIKEVDYKSYGNCKDINDFEEEQFLNANII